MSMVDIGIIIEYLSKFAELFDRSEFRRGIARTVSPDEATVIAQLLEITQHDEAGEAFRAELALLELDETLDDEHASFGHTRTGALADAAR